jgi:nucleoside 2-deoxyribosyltransferase
MSRILTIYLAGPMENVSNAEAGNWRQEAAKYLRYAGHKILDPNRKEHVHGHLLDHQACRTIFAQDLFDIEHSDLMLVNLRDLAKVARHGTAMEIMHFGHTLKRPIIAFRNHEERPHPFIESLVTGFFPDVLEACNHINSRWSH